MVQANPRVAVVLSGCGYLDGAEIQESVVTLLALDRAGAEVECLAPDKEQRDVVDHRSGEAVDASCVDQITQSDSRLNSGSKTMSAWRSLPRKTGTWDMTM